jgi:outer membrane protein
MTEKISNNTAFANHSKRGGLLRFLTCFLLVAGLHIGLFAQSALRITLLSDQERPVATANLDSLIDAELSALLASRYDLTISTVYTGGSAAEIEAATVRAYANSDFVIGSGLATSSALLHRGTYPKPTIAGIVLKKKQGAVAGAVGVEKQGAGIANFTYVESPFDVARDLEALRDLAPYERLTVITTTEVEPAIKTVLNRVGETDVDYVLAGNDVANVLTRVPAAAKAIYFTPLSETFTNPQLRELLTALTARGIATFSLLDEPFLSLGSLAAYSSSENLKQLPRRIALDVLRILDGIPAEELNTTLNVAGSGLIVNMATARAANIFPSWESTREAILLNPNEMPDARVLTLEGAILEGLAGNLGYDLAEYDVALAGADLGIAKSNLLPQFEVNTTFSHIDEQSAASSFGQAGRYNWSGQASLNQVILSEPAFANVAINKLLLEGDRAALQVSQLDVILEVSTAYLNVLQAKAFADLQNENLAVTRANLDASGTKREAGAVGAGDVYRWESELALNRIDANNAIARLAQARYKLNQLLNRPIDDEFQLPEFTGQDTLLGDVSEKLMPLLNNQRDLSRLANFMAEEAKRDLPTLKQLEAVINVQERQLLAAKRAFYLPTVGLGAQYDYRIGNYQVTPLDIEGFDLSGFSANRSSYSVGLNVSMPVFQGNARKFQSERARVATLRAKTQRKDVENKLLQRMYSNVEILYASYRNLNLAREAAETATKNFRIIEDLYRAGAVNITSLVDAQNVTLQANINATNAGYQFVADFISLERSTGSYNFLKDDNAQADFLRRFIEFK